MLRTQTAKKLHELKFDCKGASFYELEEGDHIYYPSPSTDDLLDALPKYVKELGPEIDLQIILSDEGIACVQYRDHLCIGVPRYKSMADTLREALAEMWIKLKEDNLL